MRKLSEVEGASPLLHVRLSDEIMRALEAQAKREGVTVSQLARQYIEQGIEKKGKATMVTEDALIKRINRKLKPDGEMLKRSRAFYNQGQGPYFDHNFGEFYIIDVAKNALSSANVDLEGLAKELGVMPKGVTLG